MSVRDHPTWGWFEATDWSERTQRVKKAWETRGFYFLIPPCPPIEPLGGLEFTFLQSACVKSQLYCALRPLDYIRRWVESNFLYIQLYLFVHERELFVRNEGLCDNATKIMIDQLKQCAITKLDLTDILLLIVAMKTPKAWHENDRKRISL